MSNFAIKGSHLKEFYADDNIWPPGAYHDDVLFTLQNGDEVYDVDTVPDNETVFVECGRIYLPNEENIMGRELIDVIKSWMAKHHAETFTGAELDVIFKLVKFGPCAAGDLPSKAGASSLIERGLAGMICGPRAELWYAAHPELIPVYNEHFKAK